MRVACSSRKSSTSSRTETRMRPILRTCPCRRPRPIFNTPDGGLASTTKRSSTSRRLPSSVRPTRPAPFESRPFFVCGARALRRGFRTLRREPALTQFETAQIANLCPATAEEAKSVIPRYVAFFDDGAERGRTHFLASLVKIDDDRLQALLDEIQTMRKFQS